MIADVVPTKVIGTFTAFYKVLGALGGVIFNIDTLHSNRLAYLWQCTFAALGTLAFYAVLKHWKRLGGDNAYLPPQYHHTN